jgi:type I restriction enzyme S subunit
MGEWQPVPFRQLLADPVRNGIYKPKEFHGRGVKIVNMGELFAYPRLRPVAMKRVELSHVEQSRFDIRKGDLLFARRSLVAEGAGKCSIVLDVDELTTFESSIIRARPDPSKAQPLYLFYFFNSTAGLHALDTIRRQVAVAGITGTDLVRLQIPLPSLSEQRAIAHILGTLDDKIDLNRRMNETLEAMARAIFQSWFVDFDPVRAKAEGRDPGLPKEIEDLFPDNFEDSGLGEIPTGWGVLPLGDLLSVIETGGRPKGGVRDITDGVPSVGAESIVGIGHFDYGKTKFVPHNFFESMRKGHVRDGDVLLYKDGGRPGEFEPHVTIVGDGFPFAEFCINEHVYRVRAEPALPQYYLYFWLSSDSPMDEMRNRGTGVAVPGLNSTAVRQLAVLRPSRETLRAFDHNLRPHVKAIFGNCNESCTLAAL